MEAPRYPRMTRRWLGAVVAILLLSALQPVSAWTAPVHRKGVTLAGDLNFYINNNFAELQRILDTGAGVIGVNLPWREAAPDHRPGTPTAWNDPVYTSSPAVQKLDAISTYVAQHGNGAFLMVITYNTPKWAGCPIPVPGSPNVFVSETIESGNYPAANAADYGDFMYAMSERYGGGHGLGFVRDWVVYNEVNSPGWWRNTYCNTPHYDPVYYYGGSLNAAYAAVHHLSSATGVRVLAGGFTSYDHKDYLGEAGTRIYNNYTDWSTSTLVAVSEDSTDDDHAWISPLDFVEAMAYYDLDFDAIALHPYPPKVYWDPLAVPAAGGAVSLGNISALLAKQQELWPYEESKWHLCLTEYFQHSYYGNAPYSGDQVSTVPGYFSAQTTEYYLNYFMGLAYGTGGSNKPYADYLIWALWRNVGGLEGVYVGGIVRENGSDKNEGLGSGSIRATFTAIGP